MKKLNSMFRRTEKGVGVDVFNNFRFCPVISGFFYLLPSPFFKSKVKVCFAEFRIQCAYDGDATVADLGVYVAFR